MNWKLQRLWWFWDVYVSSFPWVTGCSCPWQTAPMLKYFLELSSLIVSKQLCSNYYVNKNSQLISKSIIIIIFSFYPSGLLQVVALAIYSNSSHLGKRELYNYGWSYMVGWISAIVELCTSALCLIKRSYTTI